MYFMTKEVKEKIDPGRSILFKMDFASKGLSWVENLCQKIEVSYNKCTDVAGERLRKVLDDVASELQILSDDLSKGEVSDKCLEYDLEHDAFNECDESEVLSEKKACNGGSKKSLLPEVIGSNLTIGSNQSDTRENSKNLEDESLVRSSIETEILGQKESCDDKNKKPLPTEAVRSNDADESCKTLDDLGLVSSTDGCQIFSQENACDREDEKSLPSETVGTNCSDDAVEDGEKFSDSVTSVLAEDIPSQCHQILVNKGQSSIASGSISSTEIHGIFISHETLSSLGSPRNEREQQTEPNMLGASAAVKIADNAVTEISNGFNKEDISSSSDLVRSFTETEEFEDVKLEDIWDDTEKREIALILSRKNLSFKKKLRNALTSKLRSSNNYNRLEDRYDGGDLGSEDRQRIGASSVPSGDLQLKVSSIQDSLESEWELV